MMINLDKFFLLELQERGVDIDYIQMTEIYKSSRQRSDYKAYKANKKQEQTAFVEIVTKDQ